jgi:AraC-like DNA-binding protein
MKIIEGKPINGFMEVPADMGTGYLRGYILDPQFRIIIRHFELKESWMLDRKIDKEEHFVRISFHNVLPVNKNKENGGYRLVDRLTLPAVVIATKGLNFERFDGGVYVNSIVITVEKQRLSELLRAKMESPMLQMILAGDQPLLFEEFVSPELLRLSTELDAANPPKHLEEFYFKIKAEELIYLFFVGLLQRRVRSYQALNATDINAIYRVKEKILSDLNKPPVLADLVQLSSMSLSKLNRIFKQVFGSSIFTYYQSFRMKEAAFLIKEKNMSVSEAGYALGFSNMSHFSRLFETHVGMKPKKYAMTTSSQH